MSLDLEADGVAEAALVYTTPDESYDVYHTAGVQVLKHSPVSGWAVVFEETEPKKLTHDEMSIEKLRVSNGKDALLVVSLYSGAGNATMWHVLASVKDRVTTLNPTRQRAKVLNARDYVDHGYNGVKSRGDLIVETLPGYSRHTARCCPNRPSLEMIFTFTGSAITLDSVKELAYGLPKSGSHGPLLRLSVNGLWAYGYEVVDGFLVLPGSESPKHHAPSTPTDIVALRKTLLDQGVLADMGRCLMLTQDYKFTSMSVAAGVMLARPANGQIAWKDENGRPAGKAKPTSRAQ